MPVSATSSTPSSGPGAFDRTAFFLVADHGMEETDPKCTGNWAIALDDAGVAYRDEAYGFIYVNP